MTWKHSFVGAGLAVLLASSLTARADVVTLTDGSRLVGQVERLSGGKLKLVTEFAGALEIDAAKIESLTTEGKINVKLPSGDRLVGPVIGQKGDRSTIQTAVGDVDVQIAEADAIWPEGALSPEEIAAQEEIDARVGKWSFTAEAGITNREGNTDRLDAMGAMVLQRKSSKDLLQFYLNGQYGEQNGIRNVAEVIGGIFYENNITDRFYWFVRNEAEYDEFESLDLRYTLTTGPGYYWIREPDHELKTHLGLGYLHESYRDPPGGSRDTAQAEVGLSYFVDLTEWMRFAHMTTWYPTFESLNDYRLISDTHVLMPLGTSDMWKFKIGAQYEYDPIPQPGRVSLDELYYANIVLELKEQ
jgi:putative salt-induced outer membrane protein YdiY